MADNVDNSQTEDCQTPVRLSGADIRLFILENVGKHSKEIGALTAKHFGITRQAVSKHLQKLVAEKALRADGATRNKTYQLAVLSALNKQYPITADLAEDLVWSRDVSPLIGNLPRNVLDIWHFCFTEMFNNAIDHSGGTYIGVELVKTAVGTEILVYDNGVGIFRKIQKALSLLDERHAVLELAKGKLTTDPDKHTGQGIFFTSRLLDSFQIMSGGVYFSHEGADTADWILEVPKGTARGTGIFMKLNNHSERQDTTIFEQYTSGEDFGFTKTVVPVRLAQYGEDRLISRSQAKRLLSRVDRFQVVIFDFEGVETIGQAFADEIFRVYARSHPKIEFHEVNATPQVQQMINAARAQWASEIGGF